MKTRKTPEERPKLTDRDKRKMLQCFILLPAAFETARTHLNKDDFGENEIEYANLWNVLNQHYEQHGELPDQTFLLDRMRDVADQYETDFDLDRIEKVINGAFSWKLDEVKERSYARWALSTLRQFIEESTADSLARRMVNRDTMPTSYSDFLASEMQRLESLRSVDDVEPDEDLFPENYQPKGVVLTPTGTFIDPFLGGGTAAGEIYGFVAGFGVGKTTWGVQLTVSGAKHECIRRHRAGWDGKRRIYFMFFWELGYPDEMRFRALSCAAHVSKTALEAMRSMDDLSTSRRPGSLKPYERSIMEDEMTTRGEQERCRLWMPLLNRYTAFYDMTGQDKRHPSRGIGGIPEVRSIIERRLEKEGDAVVGGVVLDFLGAMLDRQMAAQRKDFATQLRHEARTTIHQAKHEIGGRFSCPVFLLHQLSAASNGRAPGSVAKSTDAAEIKAFPQHCDFNFALGLPNEQGYAVINCDKHRRQPPKKKQVIRILGDLARIESAHGEMTLDPVTQQIISVSERDAFAAPASRRQATTPANYEPTETF